MKVYPDWLRKPIDGVNVVSFSGGRTSAFLVYLMEQERRNGADVHYVFMDTGAEHPKTYEFIRNIVKVWGIPLVCIRMVALPMNKGVTYREVSVDDIGPDLVPFRDMLRKYGAPDAARPHCSNKMKERPFQKYCAAKFGKDYTTWLGIRADEPHRLGEKPGIRFLAELSIKKTDGKVNLAIRDEPELYTEFLALVEGDDVRTEGLKDPESSRKMYRRHRTLSEMSDLFPELTRDELFEKLKMARAFDTGNCSESCEVFKIGVD